MTYTRSLAPPTRPFFLFGPRGTGKTTWLRETFADAARFDLLPPAVALRYLKSPELLRQEVLALPKNLWVVVDEIQRAPTLLDEVHNLIENHGYKRFVLTGSSARKLKRGASNLLAGRAVVRNLFPLTLAETNFDIAPRQVLRYGGLPLSVTARNDREREDYLTAYVTTYLQEEIKAEGLVRNVGAFARFLEIATLSAGQRVNMSNLSRDAEIGRDAVRSYFSIFEDTLLGTWLPAYRPRAKVKETQAPKFYWFDSGVLYAAAGGFKQPLAADWNGILLEHWVHHELMSTLAYGELRGSLGYWATPSGSEVDFVWWYGDRIVAIEAKTATRFRGEDLKGIRSLATSKKLRSSWLVYLGDKELLVDGTHVVPISTFLRHLAAGDVIGT